MKNNKRLLLHPSAHLFWEENCWDRKYFEGSHLGLFCYFKTVIFLRIMTGGYHDSSIKIILCQRKIQAFCGHLAYREHIAMERGDNNMTIFVECGVFLYIVPAFFEVGTAERS